MGSSISGFAELADEFEDAADALDGADVEGAIDRGVETTGEKVEEDAKNNAPVRSGELREKISLQRRIRALERTVVAAADHSTPVEYGTVPHVIRPREAQALRFMAGGDVVYAAHVDHPGTQAQPYLRPALLENRSTIKREIQAELRDELRHAMASR